MTVCGRHLLFISVSKRSIWL